MAIRSYSSSLKTKAVKERLSRNLIFIKSSLHFSPNHFTPDMLKNFDTPILLVHTKLDESNEDSVFKNNSKSTSKISNGTSSSSDLLPNYNRKSILASLLNCDELFVVR